MLLFNSMTIKLGWENIKYNCQLSNRSHHKYTKGIHRKNNISVNKIDLHTEMKEWLLKFIHKIMI